MPLEKKGYTAVWVDIGEPGFFETRTYIADRDGDFMPTRQWKDCWRHRLGFWEHRFEQIIRKKLPDGMTKELASAIWDGDQNAMKKAQKFWKQQKEVAGLKLMACTY